MARMNKKIPGSEKIKGTEGDDEIYGLGGNDTIAGMAGDDYIDGGKDDDKINGNDGNDFVLGGAGHDYIEDSDGNDTIYGGSGDDYVKDLDGKNEIYGGTGDDRLTAFGTGDNLIDGGDGNDDLYVASVGLHTLIGGEGNDSLWLREGNAGSIAIAGEGNDYLRVTGIQATLIGGAGNDEFKIDVRNETLSVDAGEGNDLVSWQFLGESYVQGDDLLDGGAGEDTIRTFTGTSALSDWTLIKSFEILEALDFTATDDMFATTNHWEARFFKYEGDGDGYRPASIFDASQVTAGSFSITGTDKTNDTIIGGALDDELTGLGGLDRLTGGAGNDTIRGGDGEDTAIFSGDFANYTITEDKVNGRMVVTDNVGNDGVDMLYSINNLQFADQSIDIAVPGIIIVGTDGDDEIEGTEGADEIDGLAGRDEITSGSGDDEVDGGTSWDQIWAESGNDDIVGGSGGDTIYGGSGDDELLGGADRDTIFGEIGKDRLVGGKGIDILDGGSFADTFVLLPTYRDRDIISNFSAREDMLELDQALFGDLGGQEGFASHFVANKKGAATNELQRIVYDTDSGALLFDVDGAGGKEAVEIATLGRRPAIDADNFQIV
jgi:Ca2+-binding RTX toxin-like protein